MILEVKLLQNYRIDYVTYITLNQIFWRFSLVWTTEALLEQNSKEELEEGGLFQAK